LPSPDPATAVRVGPRHGSLSPPSAASGIAGELPRPGFEALQPADHRRSLIAERARFLAGVVVGPLQRVRGADVGRDAVADVHRSLFRPVHPRQQIERAA
jgi:hypothetical protein